MTSTVEGIHPSIREGGRRIIRSRCWGPRRFLPLFLTRFLGAFNDNLYETALLVVVVFEARLASSA